ncbi:hypothetical protein HPG69_018790 [Diceros bicornis minor]|uniref:Uncharacterized protein n=1 Tax=Diceros bicornis minor TaxID=77932 RepID=A0A7J7F8Q6_DICBM|nr:hypothetical protein HPG69_018790 [Diceros bicornis minor]
MSHLTNWKVSQVSKSLMPYDNVRVPCDRKKENKKQEDLREDQPSPHGQMLQKEEGAQITKDKRKETGDDKAAEEGPSLSKTDLRKDTKDWKLPIPPGPVYPSLISSLSTTKAVGRSWELSPQIAKSFRMQDVHMAHLPQQGPFQHFIDTKAKKRLAGRKERRSRYGDVSVHKCYQFGQIFSPFQALATTVSKLFFCIIAQSGLLNLVHFISTPKSEESQHVRPPEMRRLAFPQDLPMSQHIQRTGISCTAKGNLQDLSLSSTELAFGKDDSNQEKEKPASHIKTPLFPPIVKGHPLHFQVPSHVAVVTKAMASLCIGALSPDRFMEGLIFFSPVMFISERHDTQQTPQFPSFLAHVLFQPGANVPFAALLINSIACLLFILLTSFTFTQAEF